MKHRSTVGIVFINLRHLIHLSRMNPEFRNHPVVKDTTRGQNPPVVSGEAGFARAKGNGRQKRIIKDEDVITGQLYLIIKHSSSLILSHWMSLESLEQKDPQKPKAKNRNTQHICHLRWPAAFAPLVLGLFSISLCHLRLPSVKSGPGGVFFFGSVWILGVEK